MPPKSVDAGRRRSIKAEATSATQATQATEAAGAAIDPVANVAAQLRAGAITIERAVELLIEDAVQRQLGPALANSRELESTLRETLTQRHAENDPVLQTRIRRLNPAK